MLPNDPYMLLSYVNTKLRDEYSALGDFCEELDVPRDEIEARLLAIGYRYDEAENRFMQE